MTNTVSYNLVTDINYIMTAIINLDHNSVILILISVSYQREVHYKCDLNCSISVSRNRRCIVNVSFSTGWAFRLSQGRCCMLGDRRNTMFIYSRSYEGV